MAKIGILSMQRIKNYGSFLQAYALKKIVEKQGNKVEFVDYHIEKPIIKNNKKTNILKKGYNVLKDNGKIVHKLQYIMHKKNFGRKYHKLLGLTDRPNYNPKVDTLIIGSDEVFNCIQKNENVGYSLELFGKNNNANSLITYAASFGNTTIEKIGQYGKKQEMSELLSKFDFISVRDANSAKIIKELTNKDIYYNLDPVFIYDFMNECKEIPNLKINEKYMILYAYSGRITKSEAKTIRDYCKEKKVKIYSIGGVQPYADKFIDCSPFELLSYFKNAEFIITDTFHGTIFSIINNKQFATIVRKSINNEYGNEEKLLDLLKRVNLTDRASYKINDVINKIDTKIDYNKTNEIIKEERQNANIYLEDNIKFSKKIDIIESNCCGCGACVNICPNGAIELKENEEGFLYPLINDNKCTNCGLCENFCNYRKSTRRTNKVKAYIAVNKDKNILQNSASGGAFAGIAKAIIENQGVAYGCALVNENDKLNAKHIRVDNINEMNKIQGSKYIQSYVADCYKLVKQDLEKGKTVMFSGTPCQIDGLYGSLKNKTYENLYTIDIICHGVPSNKMFNDYIKVLEKKYKSKIMDFKFRDKKHGWGLKGKIILKNNEEKYFAAYNSSFYQLFLDSKIYRTNCYNCPYANLNRLGNITIGDFWGISKEHPELLGDKLNEKEGISCILVNDEKGIKLLETYGNYLSLYKSNEFKISKHNKQLVSPSVKPKQRYKIMNIYTNKGYKNVVGYYKRKNLIKNLIKSILKR